jgi:hypothetical protein
MVMIQNPDWTSGLELDSNLTESVKISKVTIKQEEGWGLVSLSTSRKDLKDKNWYCQAGDVAQWESTWFNPQYPSRKGDVLDRKGLEESRNKQQQQKQKNPNTKLVLSLY